MAQPEKPATGRGGWIALLLVAAFIAYVHVFEGRGFAAGRTLRIIVAVATVVVGLATMVQVYRIGDSGANPLGVMRSAAADAHLGATDIASPDSGESRSCTRSAVS